MDDSVSPSWEKLMDKTKSYAGTDSAISWYVHLAVAFVKHYSEERLQTPTSEIVTTYLK